MAAATTATSPWADLRDCISDIERLPRPSKTNMAAIHRALQDTWQSHCRKERGEAIQTVALQWSHDFQQVVSGLVQLLLRADPPERRVACKILLSLLREISEVGWISALIRDQLQSESPVELLLHRLGAFLPLIETTEVSFIPVLLASLEDTLLNSVSKILEATEDAQFVVQHSEHIQAALKYVVLLCQQKNIPQSDIAQSTLHRLELLFESSSSSKDVLTMTSTAIAFLELSVNPSAMLVLKHKIVKSSHEIPSIRSICLCRSVISAATPEQCFISIEGAVLMTDTILPILWQQCSVSTQDEIRSLTVQTIAIACSQVLKFVPEKPAFEALRQIICFTLDYWEDPVQVVKSQTQKIMEKLLKCSFSGLDHIVTMIFEKINSMGPDSKGYFSLICRLVNSLGLNCVLQRWPRLIENMESGLRSKTLTNAVSSIYIASLKDILRTPSPLDSWTSQWIDVVTTLLLSTFVEVSLRCSTEWLKPTFKEIPNVFSIVLERIVFSEHPNKQRAAVLVLSVARAKSLWSFGQDMPSCPWRWVQETLESQLLVREELVRGVAIKCILNSPASHFPTELEIELFWRILHSNMTETSPSLRQSFLSCTCQFLDRLCAGFAATVATNRETELLVGKLLRTNHDVLDAEVVNEQNETAKNLLEQANWVQHLITKLLWFCVATSDLEFNSERKIMALNLLEKTLELVASLAPLIPELAPAVDEISVRTLFRLFADRQSQVRNLALTIATKIDSSNTALTLAAKELLVLASRYRLMDYESAHCFASYVQTQLLVTPRKLILDEAVGLKVLETDDLDPWSCIDLLLDCVVNRHSLLKSDQYERISDTAMYVYLYCMESCLYVLISKQTLDFSLWLDRFARISELACDISQYFLDIMNQVFSEGSTDLIRYSAEEDVESYCWMTLRSSTSLAAVLTSILIKSDNLSIRTQSIHKYEQLFPVILLRCRHRGILEAVAANVNQIANECTSSRFLDISGIPCSWLKKQINSLRQDAFSSSISIARRAAGLPYLFTAVIGIGTKHQQVELLTQHLLDLMQKAASNDFPDGASIQTHSMYILTFLLRDATFANDMLKCIEKCLIIAFQGFISPSWVVRNASMHLFSQSFMRLQSSVATRTSSAQNPIPISEFITRFPALAEYLERELQVTAQEVVQAAENVFIYIPKLHSILLVLARLKMATAVDQLSVNLRECLADLLGCPIYSIRKLVASIFVQCLPELQLQSLLNKFYETLSTQKLNANAFQGNLSLLRACQDASDTHQNLLKSFLDKSLPLLWKTALASGVGALYLIEHDLECLTVYAIDKKKNHPAQFARVSFPFLLTLATCSELDFTSELRSAVENDQLATYCLCLRVMKMVQMTPSVAETLIRWILEHPGNQLQFQKPLEESLRMLLRFELNKSNIASATLASFLSWIQTAFGGINNNQLKEVLLQTLGHLIHLGDDISYVKWVQRIWDATVTASDPHVLHTAIRSLRFYTNSVQKSDSTQNHLELMPCILLMLYAEDDHDRLEAASIAQDLFDLAAGNPYETLINLCNKTAQYFVPDNVSHVLFERLKMIFLAPLPPIPCFKNFDHESFNIYAENAVLTQATFSLLSTILQTDIGSRIRLLIQEHFDLSQILESLEKITLEIETGSRPLDQKGVSSHVYSLFCMSAIAVKTSDLIHIETLFRNFQNLPPLLLAWQGLSSTSLLLRQGFDLFVSTLCECGHAALIPSQIFTMFFLTTAAAMSNDMGLHLHKPEFQEFSNEDTTWLQPLFLINSI